MKGSDLLQYAGVAAFIGGVSIVVWMWFGFAVAIGVGLCFVGVVCYVLGREVDVGGTDDQPI